ncbi:MAG TPA: MFS transporter [Actinoplanes sp.]|nr:MFS transporter [Actinoplanes sp.]
MGRFTGNSGTAVVCVAQFVVVLDVTIVTTALPAIRTALGFAPVDLPWVITAYTLVLGALLVAGGRIADLLGPRRAFRLGLAVFVTGSAACASAWSPAALIAARVVQGLGAALLSPAALALLTTLSEPGPRRRRAVGWWTAAAASGGASGWVLGGLLTEYFGWRTVFWVIVPIGLVALAAAPRMLPAGDRRRGAGLDLPGALAATAALGLLVWGLTSAAERGLPAVTSWVPLLLATGATGILVRHLRHAADPLVPPRLLRSRAVAGANLTALLLTATTTPAMYLSTLYVQQVLGLSPARASLLFPVFNVGVIAGSLAGPVALRRIGARHTLLAGFAGVGAGAVLLATLPGGGMPVGRLLAAFAVLGTGLGGASVASTHAGTEAAEPEHQGVAAGVLNSAAQIGTALGLAILVPFADSVRAGFLGTGALALAGLVTSLLLPSRGSGRTPAGSAFKASGPVARDLPSTRPFAGPPRQ